MEWVRAWRRKCRDPCGEKAAFWIRRVDERGGEAESENCRNEDVGCGDRGGEKEESEVLRS